MARRRKAIPPKPRPDDWDIHTETQINGRNVSPGTELSFRGKRGRFRFIELVHSPRGSWVTVAEPKQRNFRSFDLDLVKTIHTKKKSRR